MRWSHTPCSREAREAFQDQLGVSSILAELIGHLDLPDADAAKRFLNPRLADLGDPFTITHLRQAAERLCHSIDNAEVVTVFGDYDVDGVTSTAFLVGILRCFGLDPHFVVPLRMEEGYGLSREAVDRAINLEHPDLFVALDCGTNSTGEVAYLREKGIDVLIVDHHRSKEAIPSECTLINPHVFDEDKAIIRNLCTVGLVFKLVHGLLKLRRDQADPRAFEIQLREYLDLVAMGTVADMVPLVDENRVLARHGLRALKRTRRPGLRSLMKVSGMKNGVEVRPGDVSFRLAPRINASGRLADASLSVELILNRDPEFCLETAFRLDSFNRERQDIERQITEEAFKQVEERFQDAGGMVVYGSEWHPGVVGIVASRLMRHFHRPCLVLGREGKMAKGSGRSVNGINLIEVLGCCRDLLDSWGGHPMAVGVSLEVDRVPEFQSRFDAAVKEAGEGREVEPILEVASWLDLEAVTEELLDELDRLHPFGQANPEPVFATRGVVFRTRPEVFKRQHFRFSISDQNRRRLSGVAWKMADRLPPVGEPVDIAYQLSWNHYNGRQTMQMELTAWRPSEGR
ncbi:MAG: single-stranded-DNA-specific exonuclease RecJ [Verrucomicrobia bacterium]|nr:MAG: single-stranded-DNA-specific exonuclease RecJ [Verrucomicrobiota bacterium]